jgi:uncharacterized integral membrane protein
MSHAGTLLGKPRVERNLYNSKGLSGMRTPHSQVDPVERDDEAQEPADRRESSLESGIPPTRTSASWTFVAIAILALVVVLVFILENLRAADATFFGAHWRIPLGLDLLLSALLGATAVFVVGAARTLQLRLLARRRLRPRDVHLSPSPIDEPTQAPGSAPLRGGEAP